MVMAIAGLAALAPLVAWFALRQPESEKTPDTDISRGAANGMATETPAASATTGPIAPLATAMVEPPRAAIPVAPGRDETPDPPESVAPTTVRIGITNGRRGLAVKVDGRAALLPLQLPRDMQMHELLFETPNFRSERRRVRADRDQSIVLDNKPSFFVP